MNIQNAEAQVIDRMMHLLSEGSVRHLVRRDDRFAAYIDELYGELHTKSKSLRSIS